MIKLTEKQDEILTILIEECAEVIQAATKIKRFGLDSNNQGINEHDNHIHMSMEVGDLMAMIKLSEDNGIIDSQTVRNSATQKLYKLDKFSTYIKSKDTK